MKEPREYVPEWDDSTHPNYVIPESIASLNTGLTGMPIIPKGRIMVAPLVLELQVLTKKRGTHRLGDIIKPPQLMLLHEIERQLNNGGSVRIIILKARQMGLSTMIEAVIFVLSMMYSDFQSLIISHETESSQHILGMTRRFWNTYTFNDYHSEKYAARTQLAWSDNDSNIVVATAKNTGAGRSKTLHALHASEVAIWDKPDELMTGLRQAIPSMGITLIIMESTANGVGNFFHTEWQDAERGDSEFTPAFYAWFLDPEYDITGIPQSQMSKYQQLGNYTPEELVLKSMGVSDSRLLWRRYAYVSLCGRSWDKFKQEYPSTPHEAFLSTGRNVFRLPDLLMHYTPMVPEVGILERTNGRDVTFRLDPKGWLRIYRHPSPDRNWGVYQIGADPTHTTVGDPACGQVFNRRTLEQAAVYSRHIDSVAAADDLFLLGIYYNTGCIAPEITGPGGATVGKLNGLMYPNIYERILADDEVDTGSNKLGWITNMQTKQAAISWLINSVGQPLVTVNRVQYGFMLHDKETFQEMKDYVTDIKGSFKNGKGSDHDDCVMAAAIAVTTHYLMPPVVPWVADTSAAQRVQEVAALLPAALRPQTPTRTPVAASTWNEDAARFQDTTPDVPDAEVTKTEEFDHSWLTDDHY